MSIACCKPKYRIPLMRYIEMQHEDCSIDCCDTEIDVMIGVESEIYQDDEFPNLYEATCLFYNLVDVVQFGDPLVLDMYGLFHHNEAAIRGWVEKNWTPEYHSLMDNDDGEWEYSLIECTGQLVSGNVSDKTAARYVNLFKQFTRVPADGDTLVLVPAHDTVTWVEGRVVCGPQNGGVK